VLAAAAAAAQGNIRQLPKELCDDIVVGARQYMRGVPHLLTTRKGRLKQWLDILHGRIARIYQRSYVLEWALPISDLESRGLNKGDLLMTVAELGSLSLLRRAHKLLDSPLPDSMRCERMLRKACEAGYLDVAQWLVVTFGLIFDRHTLYSVCLTGNVEIAAPLAAMMINANADMKLNTSSILEMSCFNGHLNISKWVTQAFDLVNNIDQLIVACDVLNPKHLTGRTAVYAMLVKACREGFLDTGQWMAATFGLTAQGLHDMRRVRIKYDLFSQACAGGCLETVQWVAEHFGLTAENARWCDNLALRMACGGGHLAVVEWLIGRFSLTVSDICTNAVALHSSIEVATAHSTHMAEWLVKRFAADIDAQPALWKHLLNLMSSPYALGC
jgi:hypothetical protein